MFQVPLIHLQDVDSTPDVELPFGNAIKKNLSFIWSRMADGWRVISTNEKRIQGVEGSRIRGNSNP